MLTCGTLFWGNGLEQTVIYSLWSSEQKGIHVHDTFNYSLLVLLKINELRSVVLVIPQSG